MLINLSNHPTTKWGDEQREAAVAAYGEVVDLPFPNIPPEWSADEVAALVADYASRCREQLPDPPGPQDAVHLMGELTFTVGLVARLQAEGIACVASTTERLSEDLADGSRRVTFRFIQFRPYRLG